MKKVKTKIKKWYLFCFLTGIFCMAAPVSVQAGKGEEGIVLEEMNVLSARNSGFRPEEYQSEKQAVSELKKQMIARKKEIYVKVKSASEKGGDLIQDLYEASLEEDEKEPQAGDYLRANIMGASMGGSYFKPENDKNYYYTFQVSVRYYTTVAQENYVNSGIKSILSGLKLSGKSQDDKIKAIYDYVTAHVKYDNDSMVTDNPLSHTAYSAIANKTAVCQGYASLVYRLMREAGIPVRTITGKAVQSNGKQINHAWNIVEINKKWYNIDATWDASLAGGNDKKYQYFLKNTKEFSDHLPGKEFKTAQFMGRYPISSSSYEKYQSALKKVAGFKASKLYPTSIRFTWSKLPGVKYYKVAQYSPSKKVYSVKATVSTNTATIKNLKAGTKYQFIVLAYDKGRDLIGPANTPITVYTNPEPPKPKKLSASSKAITYTWNKVSSCTGYELQYSTSSKFSSSATKTIKVSRNTTTKKITSLKAKKKYYVRIRSYLTVSKKKQYSSWSAVKSIACK